MYRHALRQHRSRHSSWTQSPYGHNTSLSAPSSKNAAAIHAILRKCDPCQEEELQRKSRSDASQQTDTTFSSVDHVLSSPGESLDANTRSFLESGFAGVRPHITPTYGVQGKLAISPATDPAEAEADALSEQALSRGNHKVESDRAPDFSSIRIHTDGAANASAAGVGAHAYTVGNHIVFGAGQFDQNSQRGRGLIAHEAAHVLQQSAIAPSRMIHRAPKSSPPAKTPTAPVGLTPEQAATPEGIWAQVESGWLRVAAGTTVTSNWLLSPDEIKPLGFEATKESPPPEAKSASTAKLELNLAQMFSLLREGHPKIYQLEYRFEGGEWYIHRWELLATILPEPDPQPQSFDPNDEYVDEAERIIEEIQGTRQLVLSTAATLIAEQNPTNLENILMAAGPFAVFKIRKIAKVSRLARAKGLLKTLKSPKAIPWGKTTAKMDAKLVDMARELRATQAGVTKQAFKETNIATARVKVDGKVEYLSAGNARNSAHSEELIHTQIHELKKNHDVQLEQLYTERIPCQGACGPLLDGKYPGVQVFFTTKSSSSSSRVSDLMTAYGVSP